MMYFIMKCSTEAKLLPAEHALVKRGPPQILSVRPTSKFGFLYLKTPEGDKQYENRKRMCRLIVLFLLREFCQRLKVLDVGWLQFYESKLITGDDKQDDYADAYLQLYAEQCVKLKFRPSWAALERLYNFLKEDAHFRETGTWPLALTAEGVKRLETDQRIATREAEMAAKRQAQEEARQANPKRKRATQEEENKRLEELRNKVADKQTSVAVLTSLEHAKSAIVSHKRQKEVRPDQRKQEAEERKAADEEARRVTQQLKYGDLSNKDMAELERKGTSMHYLAQKELFAVSRADQARVAEMKALEDLERSQAREEMKQLRDAAVSSGTLSEADRLMLEMEVS